MYQLDEGLGEMLEGTFYEPELQYKLFRVESAVAEGGKANGGLGEKVQLPCVIIRTMTDETKAVFSTAREKEATDARSDDDDEVVSNTTRSSTHHFGADCPKSEIVLVSHVIVLYTTIVVSIYRLVSGHNDSNLWMALLRSSLGFLLPNPSVKRDDG